MLLRRLTFLSVLGLLAVLAQGAAPEAFPGLNRKWKYYQSPNFELYSANGERESRDVLEKMELLRALFLDTLKLRVRLPQPVTIYYFDRLADFDAYRPAIHRGSKVAFSGFCFGFPDRTVITLAPADDNESAREVVYHEYVHYLFRVAEQYPVPWFNEGVAELLSTLREEREWLILGDPVAGRVEDLRRGRMMPFEQLFAVTYDSPVFRNSGHTGIFYAQSWAFLHYCYFGVNKIPPEKMDLFLRVAGSRHLQDDPEQFRGVCRDLLGRDYPELLRQLELYITSGRFTARKVHRPEIAPKASYAVRPVAPAEATLRLAELSLRVNQGGYANYVVHEALAQKPEARLAEALGAHAIMANEPDTARERWLQAVELGSENPAVYRELCQSEFNLLFSQFNIDYRMPEERAARLRRLLEKLIASAPEQSLGYEILAWVEASAVAPEIARVNLVQQHYPALNDKPRTLLALSLVRYRLGDKAAALQLLDSLDKMNLNPWAMFCAEVLRARVEGRPVNYAKLPKSLPPAPAGRIAMPKLDLPH